MKARLFFEIEDHAVFAAEVEGDDETFEEFCHRVGGSAPAGMVILKGVGIPYNRLIRIVQLED